MSVNGIGVSGYPAWHGTRKTQNNTKADFGANIRAVAGAKNVVHIDPDALFSIQDAKTGESANVYRADDYSGDNPVYLVKGIDKNGNEYEQTVDVSKVNPNSCSYTEMLALNVHTGNKSDSNFLSMSIMKDKTSSYSYHEKADYLSVAYGLMSDMKTLGNWDGYLRYRKWIDDIQGKQSIRQYREKVFDQIAANAPKSVKQAWLDAADVAGIDGMGVSNSGKLSHISQLMVLRLEQGYRGDNVSNILGNSVQSAIRVANEALYALEHPLEPNRGRTAEQIENRLKEKMFYQEFIKRLCASASLADGRRRLN